MTTVYVITDMHVQPTHQWTICLRFWCQMYLSEIISHAHRQPFDANCAPL